MVEATLPTLGAVVVTAAVDSINPCAIGVALLLVATLIKQDRKNDILKVGVIYVAAVYTAYTVAGLGILHLLVSLPVMLANYVTVFVSLIVIAGGLLEIKDFFWYGKGTSLMIPEQYAEKIAESMDDLTVPAAILLGMFVAAVELPCTGGPYLAILTVISQQGVDMTAYGLLLLYNLIFVAPLVFIVLASYFGTHEISKIKQWKHMNRPRMRLTAGLLMVFLGWILLILATGIIRFG